MSNATPCNTTLNQELVINKLEDSICFIFERFNKIYMKVNSDSSRLLISRNKQVMANIDNNSLDFLP